jgi:translation initiation factor 1 (eIF-1/SUI1)
MFKSIVINNNREVKSLIDWGEEALSGLEKIFNELVASDSNVIKVQLNKHYLIKGKSITLVSLLKQRSEHLRDFRRLLTQIIKMELD